MYARVKGLESAIRLYSPDFSPRDGKLSFAGPRNLCFATNAWRVEATRSKRMYVIERKRGKNEPALTGNVAIVEPRVDVLNWFDIRSNEWEKTSFWLYGMIQKFLGSDKSKYYILHIKYYNKTRK